MTPVPVLLPLVEVARFLDSPRSDVTGDLLNCFLEHKYGGKASPRFQMLLASRRSEGEGLLVLLDGLDASA